MLLKNATLHCGDCLEVMKNMPSRSVDIVFTSPPYNMGRLNGRKGVNNSGMFKGNKLKNGYASYGDDLEYDEYCRWQKAVLLECWRLLTDTGAIFYNHKPRVQLGLLQTPFNLNPGLPLRQIIIWDRKGGFNLTPAFFANQHEWLMVYAKPEFRLRDRSVSAIGDVWTFPPERYNPHPAPFPVDLPLQALRAVNGDVVLDCFAGSGTTGVACLAAGKKFLGIEKDKGYCEMAKRRLYLAEQGDFDSWNVAGA